MRELTIGTYSSGRAYTVPLDLVTRTMAIIGMRGSGKTTAATVVAEEMCEAGLLFTAIDPVGVWWGLRAKPDGSPGGYEVVVIGGEHGDIPIAKEDGPRIAEAILDNNVSCILDLSGQSKKTVRHFVTEFCNRTMELNPSIPRHFFFEEAPELVPQRGMAEQQRTKAAVDALLRLGRNKGYGGTLISQRYATIDKDVLTQCENLLSLRVIGKTDRKACADWIQEVVHETESEKAATKFMRSLSVLKDGEAWFWSPQWLDRFDQIRIRARKTFHPGATRTYGAEVKRVELVDVSKFVEMFKRSLKTAKSTSIPPAKEKHAASFQASSNGGAQHLNPREAEIFRLQEQIVRANTELARVKTELAQADARLNAVREMLLPDYERLQIIFNAVPLGKPSGGVGGGNHIDREKYEVWKQKLGGGCGKVLDALMDRGAMTTAQLGAYCGLAPRSVQKYTQQLRDAMLIEQADGRHQLRTE